MTAFESFQKKIKDSDPLSDQDWEDMATEFFAEGSYHKDISKCSATDIIKFLQETSFSNDSSILCTSFISKIFNKILSLPEPKKDEWMKSFIYDFGIVGQYEKANNLLLLAFKDIHDDNILNHIIFQFRYNPEFTLRLAIQNKEFFSRKRFFEVISKSLYSVLSVGGKIEDLFAIIPKEILSEILSQSGSPLLEFAYNSINAFARRGSTYDNRIKNIFTIFDKLDLVDKRAICSPSSNINIFKTLNHILWIPPYKVDRESLARQDSITQTRKLCLDKFAQYLRILNNQEKLDLINHPDFCNSLLGAYHLALQEGHLDLIAEILETEPRLNVNVDLQINVALIDPASPTFNMINRWHARNIVEDSVLSPVTRIFNNGPMADVWLSFGNPDYKSDASQYYQETFERSFRATLEAMRVFCEARPELTEFFTDHEKREIATCEARRLTAYVFRNKQNYRDAINISSTLEKVYPSMPNELIEHSLQQVLPPYERVMFIDDLNFFSQQKKDALQNFHQDFADDIFSASKKVLNGMGHGAKFIIGNVRGVFELIESERRPGRALPSADAVPERALRLSVGQNLGGASLA